MVAGIVMAEARHNLDTSPHLAPERDAVPGMRSPFGGGQAPPRYLITTQARQHEVEDHELLRPRAYWRHAIGASSGWLTGD